MSNLTTYDYATKQWVPAKVKGWAVMVPRYSHVGSGFADQHGDLHKTEEGANAEAGKLRATGQYRFVTVESKLEPA